MKKSLLIVAVGLGVGYVLGARAGRERYDLIVEKAQGVWGDPRVARARREAARFAREQAPVVRDRAGVLGARAQAAAKSAATTVAENAKSVVGTITDKATDVATRASSD